MADQFSRQRQLVGSTADWAANNIVLGDGEIAVERAAGGVIKFKIGNGTATFSAAPYLTAGSTLTTQQLAVITALTNGTTLPGPVVLPSSVPTANDQAAHKKYVDDSVAAEAAARTAADALAVKKAGDTMTGPLVLPTGVPTGQQAVSRVEGDKLYVNLSGDTMTGPLVLPAGAPTGNQAISKSYADATYLMPKATAASQILVSSSASGYPWQVGDLDEGRY